MLNIHVRWQCDGGSTVDLGAGSHPAVPPPGAFISHRSDHGIMWRVVYVLYDLKGGATTIFVVPAVAPDADD